ncbi:MAG: hypothetical protein CSA62_04450 [Planctomycetota bacterium]|nr:MAG: hypothetical protein CSA62_04450 [Planctomycetota bacterium]
MVQQYSWLMIPEIESSRARLVTGLRSLFALFCLLGVLPAQSPQPSQQPNSKETNEAAVLQRFERLDPSAQKELLRLLERRIELDPDPLVQSIYWFGPPSKQVPVATPPPVHSAEIWAKGVAPKRRILRSSDPLYRRLRQRVPPAVFVPELSKEIWYDWQKGILVRRAEPLSPLERFRNVLRGFVPRSDAAMAELLRNCDQVPEYRRLSVYFGHCYADLSGQAFLGITLYETWLQPDRLDVPDVDSIPYAVEILGSRSFRSPIPAGPKRESLYQRIMEGALRYRKFRTLREAAAAAFVADSPKVQPGYEALLPRLHLLHSYIGDDAERLGQCLIRVGDRDALIGLLDQLILEGPEGRKREAYERRESRRAALQAMAKKMHRLALAALKKAEATR